VIVWDVAADKQLASLPIDNPAQALCPLAINPAGDVVATVTTKNSKALTATPQGFRIGTTIQLWSVSTGHKVELPSTSYPVKAITFSDDGTLLASGDGAGIINLWEIR